MRAAYRKYRFDSMSGSLGHSRVEYDYLKRGIFDQAATFALLERYDSFQSHN